MTHRPPGSGFRRRVETASVGPMLFLRRRRVAVFVVFLVLLLATFGIAGPWSALPGTVLVVLLGWVTYLSWPAVGREGRLGRAVALVAVTAFVVAHALV